MNKRHMAHPEDDKITERKQRRQNKRMVVALLKAMHERRKEFALRERAVRMWHLVNSFKKHAT